MSSAPPFKVNVSKSFDDLVHMLTTLVDADLCQTLPGNGEGRRLPESAFTAKVRISIELRGGKLCEAKSYAPQVFGEMRAYFGISSQEYMHYLSGSAKFKRNKSRGKSGSYFLFSADRRFLLKSLERSELLLLMQILPEYYAHVIQNPHTLLPRFMVCSATPHPPHHPTAPPPHDQPRKIKWH